MYLVVAKTVTLGPDSGQNQIVDKLSVHGLNIPMISILVQSDGNLTMHLNWTGCHLVALHVLL